MRYSYLVFTSPISPEKEQEYNDWYNEIHIPAIVKLDGFVGAKRFAIADGREVPSELAPRRYLAIYEIDHDDPESVLVGLKKASDAGDLGDNKAVLCADPGTVTALFQEIAEFTA